MNLKQAEIVLEKISRLYKSMKLDERNIDAFEQDLMLSYIRQLYESFSPDKPVSKKIKPVLPPIEPVVETPVEPVKAPPKPKPAPPKIPKVMETPKAPEPPKVVETPKVVVPEEVPQVSTKTEPPRIITPPVVEEAPKPATPKPTPAPTPPPVAKPAPAQGLSASDKAALFEFKAAKDLSEKLSQAPIRDLTKAMGLNEKIFTINELFGGDSKLFDDTMKKLNTFSTFDRAADYLSAGVAHSQDWISRSKKKKALNFIQLVKRRYN